MIDLSDESRDACEERPTACADNSESGNDGMVLLSAAETERLSKALESADKVEAVENGRIGSKVAGLDGEPVSKDSLDLDVVFNRFAGFSIRLLTGGNAVEGFTESVEED